MSLSRLGLRIFQRGQRFPQFRRPLQRRYQSADATANKEFTARERLPRPGDKLVGPADNAFNRELAAVKAHAAATSGVWSNFLR